MNTEWNAKGLGFDREPLTWDEKDDTQRLLTMLQVDVVELLNVALEYGFVNNFFNEQLEYINKAPFFWSNVITALRFTLVMKFAKLFDESSGAIGINKAFNILEQSKYEPSVKGELKIARERYEEYRPYIKEIKTLRDKAYAHNDKKEYQFWKSSEENDLEFEGTFWGKIEEIIIWARDTLLSLRSLTGDSFPLGIEIKNDVYNLMG